MRLLILALAIGISSEALGASDDPVLIPPKVLEQIGGVQQPGAEDELSMFGVLVDAGVPDGVGASLLVRPVGWLRVHGGVITNGFAPGIRGGVTLVPWLSVVSPGLTLEAAHYFAGDANGLLRLAGAGNDFHSPLLEDIGYRFASAQLGLELGSQERLSFFVRAGVSYLRSTVPNVEEVLQERAGSGLTASPMKLEGLLPSVKLGLQLCFG